jgi:hypothetical protein
LVRLLENAEEEFDEIGWTHQDEGHEDLYVEAFTQARVAGALRFAFATDPRVAAAEALYEAHAAIGNIEPLKAIVADVLKLPYTQRKKDD